MNSGPADPPLRGPLLLLDAAGSVVQTGLWSDGRWESWRDSREEAGTSLFEGTHSILKETGRGLSELEGFLFCEGPGSMLGIRIAAMAIQGWQHLASKPLPVFTYDSHTLLAHILLAREEKQPFHVISDARRERWNLASVSPEGDVLPLQRVSGDVLPTLEGSFFRMEEIVRNQSPVAATTIPYRLLEHASLFLRPGFLRPAERPAALLQEKPEYKKWSAERHRLS